MVTHPLSASYGTVQYRLPVSGSSPRSAFGPATTSCRTPPASTTVGGAYPCSGCDCDFQTSAPVSLSSATTWLPSPPARVMSFLPSMSGWAEYPHRADLVL